MAAMTDHIEVEVDVVVKGGTVWIVGEAFGADGWAFMGVFATKEEAVAACRTERYFVGPATIGVQLPEEIEEWPGAWYPLAEKAATEE